MEQFIEELNKIMPFKNTTDIGDIVLIAGDEPQMMYYGYVTGIERDSSRKDEWWHVHITLFTVPLQNIVWTLRTPQITGMEIFTMGGKKRFVRAIELVEKQEVFPDIAQQQEMQSKKRGEKGKVLQFKKPQK